MDVDLSPVTIPLAEIREADVNCRQHGDLNIQAIEDSLREFGQVESLLLQRSTGKLIAGHGRLIAMRRLGWTECQAVFLDIDDTQALELAIRLNRSGELATWDYDLVAKCLAQLKDAGRTPEDIWTAEMSQQLADAGKDLLEGDDAKEENPKFKTITLTDDQYATVMEGVRRMRAQEQRPDLQVGRVVELVFANYLA